MFRTREWVLCSVLVATSTVLAPDNKLRAGLFEPAGSKRPAAIKRGQSPEAEYFEYDSDAPAWQPDFGPNYQQYDDGSCMPSGWGYDSSPCFWPCSQGLFGCKTCCGGVVRGCINCGDNDHCISWTKCHRAKCGQTWYPRMAPYCVANWGWTQPCWRRLPDNYNCPRPLAQATKPQPRSPKTPSTPPAPPPAAPPANLPPPPAADEQPLTPPSTPPAAARIYWPTSSISPMSRTNVVARSAAAPRNERPVAARPKVAQQPAVAPRITTSGYTPQPQRASAGVQPLDTLERRMEYERMDEFDDDDDELLD